MSKSDEQLLKDLNKTTSPEEARNLMLNLIVPECKDIAKNFFMCLESRIERLDPKSTKYEEMEKKLNETFVPECMNNYNLEECLKKYDNNK
jgi:hypothetical protein